MSSSAPRSALRTLTSPRMLLLHVTALAAVLLAVLLSLWQYDAWQTGRDLAARDLADQAPVALADVLGPDDAYPNDQVGRPVELAGRWIPESTLAVTGRTLDGDRGRWLVTPVSVCTAGACADAPAILVVRGFLADGQTNPAAPAGRVELTGWLQPGEGSGLPDPDRDDAVLPELRIASAVQHVDTDLYGGYVIARSPVEPDLAAVTPASLPQPDTSTSLRNLLYAGEWLVFGAFAGFLWWRWSRDELDRVAAAAQAADEAGDGAEPEAPPAAPDAQTAEIASSP